MKVIVALMMLAAAIVAASSVQAACVRVALLDERGEIIIPDGLVVGMEVGTDPVFPLPLPAHRERKVIGPVKCPREVFEPIRDLYNLSCLTEQARRQASMSNSQSIMVVEHRCQELAAALTSALRGN